MLKSIASKLVAVSASAVLASAIIASSASALTVPQRAFHVPCAPQIALTSAGQVHGTCFVPGEVAEVDFAFPWASIGKVVAEWPTVLANGTFTVPFLNPELPNTYLNEHVEIVAIGEVGNVPSNEIIVDLNGYRPVF